MLQPDKYLKAHLQFQNHRHSFYEILLLLQGSGTHQIDFTDYQIQSGSLSFLSPGQVHNLQKSSIINCAVLIFNEEFIYKTGENTALLKRLSLLFTNSPVALLSKPDLDELALTLLLMKNELDKESIQTSILHHSLHVLLLQILRCCNEGSVAVQQATGLTRKRYFDFLQLIENNYEKEHSVQYYAKELNIDPKRLNEITQAASGDNALQLIQKRILVEAKRLLFYSNLSIKEIAYQLGFEDVSYFSKFFQKKVGVRPSTFQESNPETTI